MGSKDFPYRIKPIKAIIMSKTNEEIIKEEIEKLPPDYDDNPGPYEELPKELGEF